jgi:hypothetical protein
MTIYILNRQNLQELGRLGRAGRMAGNFHYLHQVSIDSAGNIYTAEVDSGKRLQKFLRYGLRAAAAPALTWSAVRLRSTDKASPGINLYIVRLLAVDGVNARQRQRRERFRRGWYL